VTVDGAGQVIVDEDTQGASNYAGKIWMIDRAPAMPRSCSNPTAAVS
jgi:hypothetical protein